MPSVTCSLCGRRHRTLRLHHLYWRVLSRDQRVKSPGWNIRRKIEMVSADHLHNTTPHRHHRRYRSHLRSGSIHQTIKMYLSVQSIYKVSMNITSNLPKMLFHLKLFLILPSTMSTLSLRSRLRLQGDKKSNPDFLSLAQNLLNHRGTCDRR